MDRTNQTLDEVEEIEEEETTSSEEQEPTLESEADDDETDNTEVGDDEDISVWQSKYRTVLKESMKRKALIKELRADLEAAKVAGTTDESLKAEVEQLKNANQALLKEARMHSIQDGIVEYLEAKKKVPASTTTIKDLALIVSKDILDEWDTEDIEANLPELVGKALKTRPNWIKKLKAPEIDATRNGQKGTIPEDFVEDVARTFNLSN